MSDKTENLPLDTRLLSEAIIELNISRHNVSIYPRNHPIVEKSLNQAFDFFQKLFELRKEITLAIAKDSIIIDDYSLDNKNPVYREFALSLNNMNIAHVTFISGLSKEELYSFHGFILTNIQGTSPEEVKDLFKEYNLLHIKIGFIDYSAFKLVEGEKEQEKTEVPIWEKYILGLLEGRLQSEEVSDVITEVPPVKLAGLINRAAMENIKQESYDRVITSYVRKSSERAFSAKELKKLLDFINQLRPELKGQFLSSTVNTVSKDLDSVNEALGDMSVDDVIDLLSIINEQMVAIPEALKNVLNKFSRLHQDKFQATHYGGGLIEDDILLSPEVTSLLKEADFKSFVSDSYQQEIQRLLKCDPKKNKVELTGEFKKQLSDEYIESVFHQIILELAFSDGSEILTQEDYEFFINILKEQLEQFVDTGQYKQVLKTLRLFESNIETHGVSDLTSKTLHYCRSPKFISLLIDSLRIIGREMREDAFLLCEYYGDKIIPQLMNALNDEESQSIRRFIISLITHFGDKVTPEATKGLDDSRWFVKRNMLYILNECGSKDAIQEVRKCCNHENPKVSFEAIKYLLNAKDNYSIKSLKEYLRSESRDLVARAIILSGAFKVNDVVPDLIQMLKKKTITGLDFENRIPIVQALGQIGDPRALDTMRNILSSKSFLFKGSLKKLKEAIRRTLKNYNYDDVKDLRESEARFKNDTQEKSHKGEKVIVK